MNKKILIIIALKKFYKIDRYKYEIDEYKKNNFTVEMHQMVDCLYPSLKKNFKNNLRLKEIKNFNNFKKWKHYLKSIVEKYGQKNILIINDIPVFNLKSLNLNYLIKKYYKLKIVERYGYEQPAPNFGYKFTNYFHFFLNLFFLNFFLYPKKTLIFFHDKFFDFLKIIFNLKAEYLLVCGKKFLKNVIKNKKKIILGNSYDYNLNLTTKNIKPKFNIKNNYAIFLESPTPIFKGDATLIGVKKNYRMTVKNWTSSLNNFFSFLEKELNLKVFISAHPKVKHRSNFPNYYYGRRVLNDFSCVNTRNAKLIITRMSTGSSYAIINNIPVTFIYSNELISHKNFIYQQKMLAKEFGKVPINIDDYDKNKLMNDVMTVNKKKYQSYKQNYLTLLRNNEKNSKNLIKLIKD